MTSGVTSSCVFIIKKGLVCLTQVRHLAFGTPKARKMNFVLGVMSENALEPCYRQKIIPLSGALESAVSWTLFMGRWDHVFHLRAAGRRNPQDVTCNA